VTYPSKKKYESQLGLLFPIYGKIKKMFQTTNQKFLWKLRWKTSIIENGG
jgi:hypothetical protein